MFFLSKLSDTDFMLLLLLLLLQKASPAATQGPAPVLRLASL